MLEDHQEVVVALRGSLLSGPGTEEVDPHGLVRSDQAANQVRQFRVALEDRRIGHRCLMVADGAGPLLECPQEG